MATKSFTTTMKFNRKNVDDLLKALNNEKKANKSDVKINVIRNDAELKQMFAPRKEIKHV